MDLTPTQEAMWRVLSDGEPHSRAVLHELCGPSSITMVACHIARLRRRLEPGLDIVCMLHNNQVCYRLMRIYHQR